MGVRRVFTALVEVVGANKARFAVIAALVVGAATYGSKAFKAYEFAANWISGHVTVTNGVAHPQTALVLLVCSALRSSPAREPCRMHSTF